MKKPEMESLLNDLLESDEYGQFRSELKRKALGEVRRRRHWRQIRGMTLIVAVPLVGLAILFCLQTRPPEIHSGTPAAADQAISRAVEARSLAVADRGFELRTISDEQLLASFPPGSCFLAEINGETVLVFSDPSVRDAMMR